MVGMVDIVGIDTPCMDFAIQVDSLPKPNSGAALRDYTWQGGGKISTGFIAAARLGAKCAILGVVGDDLFGRAIYHDFKRHGVDVSQLLIRPGTTSVSVVLSDAESKGRSIIHKPGSSGHLTEDDDIDLSVIKGAKYFFLSQMRGINIKAARYAKEHGVKVFIDADHPHPGLRENIGLIDAFVASEFVYDDYFPGDDDYEKNCAAIREMGPEIVVFTFGEKGCVGMDSSGFFNLPAYSVTVMDTLGAGDVYHGAYLAGLVRGWDAKKTAGFANAVSAIKVTRAGGRAGIPDFDTTIKFMETGVIDYTEIDQRVEYYKRGLDHA